MKKIEELIGTVIVFAIIGAMFFGFLGMVGYMETHYTKKATVSMVCGKAVYFEDECGLVWAWDIEDTDNFTNGQKVKLTFDNNCTETYVYDDIIVRVR